MKALKKWLSLGHVKKVSAGHVKWMYRKIRVGTSFEKIDGTDMSHEGSNHWRHALFTDHAH